MKKRLLTIFGVMLCFFLFSRGSQGYRDDDYSVSESRSLSLYSIKYDSAPMKNVRGNVKNIPILGIQLNYAKYGVTDDKYKTEILKRLIFDIVDIKGYVPADWIKLKLVIDTNTNDKIDKNDKIIPIMGVLQPIYGKNEESGDKDQGFVSGKILFDNLNLVMEHSMELNIFLAADLSNIEEGDSFKVVLEKNEKNIVVGEPSDKVGIDLFGTSISRIHYAGNRAPNLEFIYNKGYDKKRGAVSNVDNLENTDFEFSVLYKDADNDAPVRHYLEIDTDGNGQFQKIEMKEDSSDYIQNDPYRYASGFVYKVTIKPKYNPSNKIRFRFIFGDGETEASDEPSKIQKIDIMPMILVSNQVELSASEILPGQKITMNIAVLSYQGVSREWDKIIGQKYSNCIIRDVKVKRTKIYENKKNYEITETEVLIEPIKKEKFGKFTLNSIKIPFKINKETKKGRVFYQGSVLIPKVEFKVLPININLPILSKTRAAQIGDRIELTLRIMYYGKAELKTDIKKLLFNPFVKLFNDPTVYKTTKENITTAVYVFSTLLESLPTGDETGLTFPEQEIEIKFGDEVFSVIVPARTISFSPTLSKKELKNPLPIEIAEILPRTKLGAIYSYKTAWYAGIGLVMASLFSLLVYAIKLNKDFGQRHQEKENIQKARQNLFDLMKKLSSQSIDAENTLPRIFSHIQRYIGLVCKINQANINALTPRILISTIKENSSRFSVDEIAAWDKLITEIGHLIYDTDKNDKINKQVDTVTGQINLLAGIVGKKR